jgi:hypothetical protein
MSFEITLEKKNEHCYGIKQDDLALPLGLLFQDTEGQWSFYSSDAILEADQMEVILTKMKGLNND